MLPELFAPSRSIRRTPRPPRFARGGVCIFLLCSLAACGAGPESDGRDADTGASVPSRETAGSTANGGGGIEIDVITEDERWVTGSTRMERGPMGPVTVSDINAARHDTFDRFVITLAGDTLPTHTAEIVPGPAVQCGSGEPVELPGQSVLLVRLEPAQAHDDAGNSTLQPRDTTPGLPVLLEARLICDFEGHVEWAFGIADATAFRVLELTEPTRIVVDIQH